MEFIWNDGGRAACGFVGTTGDCVTRSIAIATGVVYRDVYAELGGSAQKSPRNGVPIDIVATSLARQGWESTLGSGQAFSAEVIPKGVVIVQLTSPNGRSHHLTTVIDHVVHDTWNAEDDEYLVSRHWTCRKRSESPKLASAGPRRKSSAKQDLAQDEFDKIMRRLRALDKTASNDASTEGEKRNALRMMQSIMLTHNLDRDDIVDNENVDSVYFTRIACPVNGRQACTWERKLAGYLVEEIFPTVQWYRSTKGHRTLFWFYGPLSDVENCIALFRELLLTIAASASLQYGSYVRGSGASYAEGYVSGLPRPSLEATTDQEKASCSSSLIQTRVIALHDAATRWLEFECNVKLSTGYRRGRYLHDPAAESRGKVHGASQEVKAPNAPKRIAQT